MKKLFLLVAFFSIVTSCATKTVKAITETQKFQTELVDFYANPKTTPLNEEEKAVFKGITFFPIDEKYCIEAEFKPLVDGNVIPFPTSAGKIKHYKEYGIATFHLNGKQHQLTIYQSSPIMEQYKDHLFLPFTDDTNGNTTYGGGRYIDLSIEKSFIDEGKVLIDFNQSYNPYCAYSKRYNCPIPPGNNSLETEIKAGVTYKK